MSFVGHGQSRSVPGSFREFYELQQSRAESLSRVDDSVAGFQPLVMATVHAIGLVHTELAETHALLLTQPFDSMARCLFAEPMSRGAKALADVDVRIAELRKQLELAHEGRAHHQLPSVQSVVPLSAIGAADTSAAAASMVSFGSGGSQISLGPSASAITSLSGGGVSTGNLPPDPNLWPSGVFQGWGSSAAKWGVGKTDAGLSFGQFTHVSFSGAAVTFKQGTCVAAAAPNAHARNRSQWCVTPLICKALGFAAHERVEGTTEDQYVVANLKKSELPKCQWVVNPCPVPCRSSMRLLRRGLSPQALRGIGNRPPRLTALTSRTGPRRPIPRRAASGSQILMGSPRVRCLSLPPACAGIGTA